MVSFVAVNKEFAKLEKKSLSSGIECSLVPCNPADVLEKTVASFFRVEE
jgi:hypothetical protein